MEVFDKDIQFLKDIWSNNDQREITKRVIAVALSGANPCISLGDVQALSAELDDLLLEKEQEVRLKDQNLTV